MIKLLIAGAAGRMGIEIGQMAVGDRELKVIYGLESDAKADASSWLKTPYSIGADADQVEKVDVVIDFTTPAGTMIAVLPKVEKYGKPYVIGTTGFNTEQDLVISKLSKKIPIVKSPNMSRGLNILLDLVVRGAKLLEPMNMTVEESHHRHKKDAPSGSSKMLGESLAAALKLDPLEASVFDGGATIMEEEAKRKIFFTWRRSSEIVGEHTVFLGGWGEELRLGHAAHDRKPFAAGALHAAKWVVKQKPGLYTMQNVLGLK